jgi:DNA-binding beta-propeller fold protein YncE
VFSVNYVGKVTKVSGSPFSTGSYPGSVAFSSDGTLLATADEGTNKVSVFSVSSAGKLKQLTGSPFESSPTGYKGPGPDSIAFSPDGFLLATANTAASTTSVFSYGQTPVAVGQPPGGSPHP